MSSQTLRARRGFTLPEIIISMALMLAVIGMATRMFTKQSASVSSQTGRADALQNSRFAMAMLERELRAAGAGVADQQPLLVMANTLGITFNANLTANDTGDLSAVYINPDADSAAVDLLHKSTQITLPGTSKQYPDTDYTFAAGVFSHAETISYYLSRDSTSSRNDEYVFYRRVNAQPPRMVAKGIIYNPGRDTIFHYLRPNAQDSLIEVSPTLLPLIHTAPIHGTATDVGNSALTDSIREVQVTLTSVFRNPRTPKDSILRPVSLRIHLMNAGLLHHSTCGDVPLAPTNVIALATAANGTTVPQTYVTVSWTKSGDDGAREKDVERYALYRRLSSVATFDEPFSSVPAGSSTYSFTDTDVQTGQTWIYAVAAQDCSPSNSSSPVASAAQLVIP